MAMMRTATQVLPADVPTVVDPPVRDRSATGGRAHDLDEIDVQICRLFALVVDGLAAATSAFLSGDRAAAHKVVTAETLVDRLHQGTEALLDRQLLSVAGDIDHEGLARLVLALRIAPELERSGDLVEHIAARASGMVVVMLPGEIHALIRRMSEVGVELWRRAARSFGGVDTSTAGEFRLLDDELDDLHFQLRSQLAASHLPSSLAIEMALVARFYERLGDHAVNVARRIDQDAQRRAAGGYG